MPESQVIEISAETCVENYRSYSQEKSVPVFSGPPDIYLEVGAGLNATITDHHIRLTPNILLGYLCSHFGAKQGQKMMP